jgi:sec-independent protein translocase protein TatA
VFRGLFEGWTPVIIIVVIVLLFGAPKLPGLARSLGQSLRIFRGEMKQMKDDKKTEADQSATPVRSVSAKSSAAKSASGSSTTSPTRASTSTRKPAAKKPSA